jgi:hypothetical protein
MKTPDTTNTALAPHYSHWAFSSKLAEVDVERILHEAKNAGFQAIEISVKTPFCGERREAYCTVDLYDAIYNTIGQKTWPKVYAQKAYRFEAKSIQLFGLVIADWVRIVDSYDNSAPLDDFLADYQAAKKIWETPVRVIVKGFELSGPPKQQ